MQLTPAQTQFGSEVISRFTEEGTPDNLDHIRYRPDSSHRMTSIEIKYCDTKRYTLVNPEIIHKAIFALFTDEHQGPVEETKLKIINSWIKHNNKLLSHEDIVALFEFILYGDY